MALIKKKSESSQETKAGGLSFLKRGKAAQEAFAKEEHKAEQAAANAKNKIFRFFVKDGEETVVTFLDGNLSDGVLDIPFYYEHNINMNGKWGNFYTCTQDEEPCPICEGGNTPSYVGVMTVIDHSEYKGSNGQLYKDTIKLFVAKRETIKLLQKHAVKRGGLRGCMFDVSRTGDRSASVGNVFDFSAKLTEQQLLDKWKEKATPINYEKLLSESYLPAKELRKMGFGNSGTPIGGESSLDDSSFDNDL